MSVEGNGFSGALYTELLNPESKGARVKPEQGGGSAFTFDLPAGFLKDI